MTTYTEVFGSQAIPSSESSYAEITLSSNQQFYWPETSSGTYLLYDILDIQATGAFEITFPSAMEVSVGRMITFNNLSLFTITLKDSLGTQIGTLATGEVRAVYLTDNSTVQGVWEVIGLGSGTTTANASALAGAGLKVISSQLAQNYDAVSLSATTYSLMLTDRAKTLISYGGALALDLIAAASATNGYMFSLSNQGTGSITINPSGSELIDELTTKDIAPGESAFVICNGTKWVTVGYGRSTQFQFTKLVLDITTGSPFTLTSVQAQNKLMQFIGTAPSNITVIVPAVVAVYYLQCSYSGAYSLTIKTASGASVVLANTDRAIIYCDGTDVVLAQTSSAPATTLTGGASGSVVYQSAPNVTAFVPPGTSGQLMVSGGSGAPVWVNKTASNIANVASGGIAATDVQAALNELDTEKAALTSLIASNIVNTPAGGIAATNVQTALNELDTEKAPKADPVFTGNGSIAGTLAMGSAFESRNKLINGGMRIKQRGGSVALSSAFVYGVDQWLSAIQSGTGITATVGTILNSTWNSGSVQVINGTWTNGQVSIAQRIEAANTTDLQGKALTLSATLYQLTGGARTFVAQLYKANTIDNFTGVTLISSMTLGVVPDAVITKLSCTYPVLSQADVANGLMLILIDSAANSVTSKSYFFGDIQLESGTVATPFVNPPIGLELALCQRHVRPLKNISGQSFSTSTVGGYLDVSSMFVFPTLSTTTGFNVLQPNGTGTGCSITINNSSGMAHFAATGAAGLTLGASAFIVPPTTALLIAEL